MNTIQKSCEIIEEYLQEEKEILEFGYVRFFSSIKFMTDNTFVLISCAFSWNSILF